MGMLKRDTLATWRTTGALCRERDWSKPRLLDELLNGLRYRTVPPGHVFNWHDPTVRRALDLESSTVPLGYASASSTATVDTSWTMNEAIGIEVLPPDATADLAAVEAPDGMRAETSVADTPAASPAPPEPISNAKLRETILAIKKDHPNDPLDVDKELWPEVQRRLGQSVARDDVRAAHKKVAPDWVKPVGRPRKSEQ